MKARGGRLERWFGQPVRWLCFLAGGIPPVLVFPAPSLSYVAWFALVPGMVLFVRASKPGDNILAGVSTRRLISLRVALNQNT